MVVVLECVAGASRGLRVEVSESRPRAFRLQRDGVAAGMVQLTVEQERCWIVNRSERSVLVNGSPIEKSSLEPGDRVVMSGDEFLVQQSAMDSGEIIALEEAMDGIEVLEPVANPEARRRRALSASAVAALPDQPRAGLLGRVSAVLATRGERQRLDRLTAERNELLAEAGRLAVRGVLGLPPSLLGQLKAGRPVTVLPEELNRAALDEWHGLTTRLALVEAELAALRKALRLPAEGMMRSHSARLELREREDRVHAVLDDLGTADLEQHRSP